MSSREFSLAAVLSITTGKLLCDIGEVYAILNFLTGDNLFTHQLPRAMREAQPFVLRAHPQLGFVDSSDVTGENWQTWLAERVIEHGAFFALSPMPAGEHEVIDPLSELAEMVHPEKIIVVNTDEV